MNGRAVISFLPKLAPLTWFRTTAPLRRQDQHLRRGDPSDRSHDARGDGRRPGPLRPRDLRRRRRDGRRVSHIRREEDRGSSLASRSRSTRCSSADVSRMKISIVYEACSARRIRLPRRVPTAYGRRILRKPRFTDRPIRPRGNPVPPTRKNASRCREMCSYGARSPNSIIRLTRSLAATIRTARTHQIEGAGHAAPLQHPISCS